jgi:hypothetical protein
MKFFDRGTFTPGTIFLLIAFVAGLLSSVSLPVFRPLEVVRTHFNTDPELNIKGRIEEARFGVWSGCAYLHDYGRHCTDAGVGYEVGIAFIENGVEERRVGKSWTRGLILTPVATFFAFVALGLALVPGGKFGLFASGMSFIAALVMLLAFIIDIILLLRVKDKFRVPGADTNAGAGFWLTFISFIFLVVSGCTVCIGHRRAQGRDIELGNVFKRFRR